MMEQQAMEIDTTPKGKIDEGLYSRQLYVLNHADMLRITTSNILLLGLRGTGSEIAKNIILAGVKAVTLFDPELVDYADLSANCFLREEDIGKARAHVCLSRLSELNEYVEVSVYNGELDSAFISNYQVVVATDWPLEQRLQLNEICHGRGVCFITTETRGVFGSIFCDFGDRFVITDTNGEPPFEAIVSSITNENPGIVTITEEKRLQLETGDAVVFSEVKGMTQLNGTQHTIKVLGPYSFSIGDTSTFDGYVDGGIVKQIKPAVEQSFLPLSQSIEKPVCMDADLGKLNRPQNIHIAFLALNEWMRRHSSLPLSHHKEHAEEMLQLARDINGGLKLVEDVDEAVVIEMAYGARGQLIQMASLIGGVAGQEVLKACSGKFSPINQWLHMDMVEMLPSASLSEEEFQPLGSRYDGLIQVLGRSLVHSIHKQSYFLVGAGAIGCEVLKNWALLGLGTQGGCIHVTDMDSIERSNLNRQFLFRANDIERLKSEAARDSVLRMNPQLNVQAYPLRVGTETEATFGDEFYENLNGVCNALDNVEARLYMDNQCIYHRKPLLESGTLGTKANSQVIVPFLTESYASSRDPPEKTIPVCTLHHFPNKIEHTIHWASDQFQGLFSSLPESVNAYLSNPSFTTEVLGKMNTSQQLDTLRGLESSLVTERPLSLPDCIAWARRLFQKQFHDNILQLLHNFPPDALTPSGARFWSGPKRAPAVISFDEWNDLHLDFIIAATNLRAFNFGLKGHRDKAYFREEVKKVDVPLFKPAEGVKIQTKENETIQQEDSDVDKELVQAITKRLPTPSSLAGYRLAPCAFEKDDDTNFHIDFITAASNLRATNYSIETASAHVTKGIAGKIIPALVTTTAVAAALVNIELVKLIDGKNKLTDFRNAFVNLALPFIGLSEPIAPPTGTITPTWSWTLWDRFDLEGPLTLRQFLEVFKEKHGLEISVCSSQGSIIYSFFMPRSKLDERLDKELSSVVIGVSGKGLPAGKKRLLLDVVCSRIEDGDDVDVPYIAYLVPQQL